MKKINIAIDDRTGKYFVPDDSPNDDYYYDEDEQFISNRKDFKTVDSFIYYAKSVKKYLAENGVPERIY